MMLCAARKVEAFQLRWPNRVEEWRPAVSLSCWEICDAQRKAGVTLPPVALLPSSRACYKLARPLTTKWHALAFSHSIDLSHQQTSNSSVPLHQEEPDELLRTSKSHLNNFNHHHVSALSVNTLSPHSPASPCRFPPFGITP